MQRQPKSKCFVVDEIDHWYTNNEPIKQEVLDRVTPMRKQYCEIKEKYPNEIVLFHKSPFYQAYDQDAVVVQAILGLNWTGKKAEFRKVGINEKNIEWQLYQLIRENLTVVVCQQQHEPAGSKQKCLKDRRMTGIYSKGLIGIGLLNVHNEEENYLLSIYLNEVLVLETISKIYYYTTKEDLPQIEISEIISQDPSDRARFKGAYFNKGIGGSALEQLSAYFAKRKLNVMDQFSKIYSVENSSGPSNCRVSVKTLQELCYKQLFNVQTKEGQLRLLLLMQNHDLNLICDTQIAVQELSQLIIERKLLHANLKSYQNLRRRYARLLNLSKPYTLLRDFFSDVRYMQNKLQQFMSSHTFRSQTLTSIKIAPSSVLQELQNQVLWCGSDNSYPMPQNLQDQQEYKNLEAKLTNIQREAAGIFELIKETDFENSSECIYRAKDFSFEIPESISKPGYVLISKRAGHLTYQSNVLHRLHQQYLLLQDQNLELVETCYQKLIGRMRAQGEYFDSLFSVMAKLDVLCAFSEYLEDDAHSCFPTISTSGPALQLEEFKHPLLPAGEPNSLVVRQGLILSGENGAGKSTLIRAVGLNFLLAQLGCRVPCKRMIFRPKNIIVTSMGQVENLRMSTFQQQLLEAKALYNRWNALVLMDQFASGTAPKEAQSLAYSFVKHFLSSQRDNTLLFTSIYDLQELSDMCEIMFMENHKLKYGQVIHNLCKYIL